MKSVRQLVTIWPPSRQVLRRRERRREAFELLGPPSARAIAAAVDKLVSISTTPRAAGRLTGIHDEWKSDLDHVFETGTVSSTFHLAGEDIIGILLNAYQTEPRHEDLLATVDIATRIGAINGHVIRPSRIALHRWRDHVSGDYFQRPGPD